MRLESMLCLLFASSCSPRPPEAEAPGHEVAAVEPQAVPAESEHVPPAAAASPAPDKSTSTAVIPGDIAPSLEIGDAERAAADAVCKQMSSRQPYRCEPTKPLPGYLLVRLYSQQAEVGGHHWYVMRSTSSGYVLVTDPLGADDGPDAAGWPAIVCGVRTKSEQLPAGLGVVRVMHPDLNLDGRDDLLVECRGDDGGHELRYCLSGAQGCEETLWLRRAWGGHVDIELDVEFRDGWFIRTVRIDSEGKLKGNLRVDGVKAPDPAP